MNDDTATLKGIPFNLEKHVDYADGSVVSKTLIKKRYWKHYALCV